MFKIYWQSFSMITLNQRLFSLYITIARLSAIEEIEILKRKIGYYKRNPNDYK